MNRQDFFLCPFSGSGLLPGLKITGTITRQVNILILRYVLSGFLTDLIIPGRSDRPTRRFGLWEETCFELFIAERPSPRYWEFNLSPSGDWNVFRFEAYRQGLFEEWALSSLPFSVQSQSDSMMLVLEFDLGLIFQAERPLEIALSAVLRTRQGEESLWALVHSGPKADFHCRESFLIKL
jgi:hypothetical protein